jgi:hypothetical protein
MEPPKEIRGFRRLGVEGADYVAIRQAVVNSLVNVWGWQDEQLIFRLKP